MATKQPTSFEEIGPYAFDLLRMVRERKIDPLHARVETSVMHLLCRWKRVSNLTPPSAAKTRK